MIIIIAFQSDCKNKGMRKGKNKITMKEKNQKKDIEHVP